MNLENKTKKQLIIELEELRQRFSELQTDVTERNRYADQRNKNYVFLQKLIDTIPAPIFYKDRSGRYLGCNKSFEDYIGLTRDEIVGKTVYDVAPKELADKYYAMDEELFLSSGKQVYEYSVKYADGTLHDVIFNKSTFSDMDGNVAGLVGVMLDITERKRAEEEIRKREELLQGIFTSAYIVIWAIDRNGIFTLSEGRALKALNLKPGEVVGHSVFDIYRGYPKIIDAIQRALTGEELISTLDVEGIVFEAWYSPLKDEGGNITGAFGVAADITDRVNMENTLKENEERYRIISENTSDYFYTLSLSKNGDISADWIGGAFERITGYSVDEIPDFEKWFSIVHPDDRNIIQRAKEKVLSDQRTHVEYRIITRAGNEIWLRDSSRLIRDYKRKGVVTIIGAVKDITDRKRMEEELRRAHKLESVGMFAGGIAHDFNNILTGILGNINLAKMHIDQESKAYERLEEAERASMRAGGLTQQLLTFSKGGAPVKNAASVDKLLRESAGFAMSGSNVKCEFHFDEKLWPVEVDEGQISQVIHNLILNADQSMPEGGIIHIHAENSTAESGVVYPFQGERNVKITIEDQGMGIPEEHLQKLFDPYFTTKETGRGLGLAIAYSIVKNHDGYITAKSKLGMGTIFTIYLPASETHDKAEGDGEERIIQGEGKILIMDDEELVLNTTGEMLKSLGYKAELAKDGSEAIEMYKKAKDSGDPFVAVIMDLTIPGGMGGKEVIQKLITLDPKVKAIVSSGYSNDPVMANFTDYGFSAVITKPYKRTELSRILHKVLMGSNEEE